MPKLKIGDTEIDLDDRTHGALAPIVAEAARLKAELSAAAEERGRQNAEAQARLAAETDAKRKTEQDSLIKKGEYDKALELERGRTAAVAAGFAEAQASALLGKHLRQDLSDAERADAVATIRGAFDFDLTAGKLIVRPDRGGGEPAAFVEKWLADRPSIRAPKPAAGSGSGNNSNGAPDSGAYLPRSKMSADQRIDAMKKLGTSGYLALPL